MVEQADTDYELCEEDSSEWRVEAEALRVGSGSESVGVELVLVVLKVVRVVMSVVVGVSEVVHDVLAVVRRSVHRNPRAALRPHGAAMHISILAPCLQRHMSPFRCGNKQKGSYPLKSKYIEYALACFIICFCLSMGLVQRIMG